MSEKSIPTTLSVTKENIKDFRRLLDEKDSLFYGKTNKDVFLAAMVMGVKTGKSNLSNREGFFRSETLTDDDKTIMKALAVSETGNLLMLLDMQKVFQVAEEYATGGIDYLTRLVFNNRYGAVEKQFESELLEEFGKLNIK